MAKILKFFRVIRNNWKKSLVGTAALSYGVSYSKETYEIEQLMRENCETVSKSGDVPLPTNVKPRHVTVILNPAAKKGKAKKLFQKYCEPLLHLAGIAVTIIQTQPENAGRKIVMNLDTPTDALIVAGGDGTVSDVLTGLVRKYNSNFHSVKQCPIGIIPLGKTNKVANSLYEKYDNLQDVRGIIEATMAVINEKSQMMDIIEIEALEHNIEEPIRPIYAMGGVEWGAWIDPQASYWGWLKKYANYLVNGYEENLKWNCNAMMKYTDPCTGCSQCYQNTLSFCESSGSANKRWWHAFLPRKTTFASENTVDYSKIINEECSIVHEVPVSTSQLEIETSNVNKSQVSASPSSIKVQIAPKDIGYLSSVIKSWKDKDEMNIDQRLEAKSIELIPESMDEEQKLYIDNEEYELKAIRIKLLPKAVKIFCSQTNS